MCMAWITEQKTKAKRSIWEAEKYVQVVLNYLLFCIWIQQ